MRPTTVVSSTNFTMWLVVDLVEHHESSVVNNWFSLVFNSKHFPFLPQPTISLSQFYPYIRCPLCCGFLIDATTITECLHTFCKSCIVKYFFYSNRCPTCSIVVHQTQPLYNIRPDRQLQDIVYKMVPFLEHNERELMCKFYNARALEVPKPELPPPPTAGVIQKPKKDSIPRPLLTVPSVLDVSLLLDFVGAEEGICNYKPLDRRYVRVSSEATIRHVELFIRKKMELSPTCQVRILNIMITSWLYTRGCPLTQWFSTLGSQDR
uniref:Polycomb group ring finger 6 n=1 Tax=Gouania willdenowi TaxID=441366 RepID=A0A8C5GAS3_GOUWI